MESRSAVCSPIRRAVVSSTARTRTSCAKGSSVPREPQQVSSTIVVFGAYNSGQKVSTRVFVSQRVLKSDTLGMESNGDSGICNVGARLHRVLVLEIKVRSCRHRIRLAFDEPLMKSAATCSHRRNDGNETFSATARVISTSSPLRVPSRSMELIKKFACAERFGLLRPFEWVEIGLLLYRSASRPYIFAISSCLKSMLTTTHCAPEAFGGFRNECWCFDGCGIDSDFIGTVFQHEPEICECFHPPPIVMGIKFLRQLCA